jgi:D-alanyl-D-alanine carboxypeptidase/D-alanyl-D-alanine-endopeptidase (penicillin-binding protein 4)
VVVDDSIFDREWTHPDWPADQQDAWYQAPVGGLNLNDNCLDARVVIRERVAQLVLRPDLPAELISNRLSVSKQHKPTVTRKPGSDLFEFRGPVARAAGLGPVSAGSPTIFFSFALRRALEAHGVVVAGSVVRRTVEPRVLQSATLVAVQESALRDAIWRANTFSQNLFAECLLKALAAYEPDGRRAAQPGSFERGAAQLRATLERLGVPTAGAVFRDGSGLSHDNRVTADMLVRLLRVMHQHRQREPFLASLARAGEEGSMKRRFGDGVFRGRLIGKTGTISGVSTFAGYATRADGTTLAFAILVNGPAPENLPVRVSRVLVGR